jgi:hypothetical protein
MVTNYELNLIYSLFRFSINTFFLCHLFIASKSSNNMNLYYSITVDLMSVGLIMLSALGLIFIYVCFWLILRQSF